MSGTKKILYHTPPFQKIRMFHSIVTKQIYVGLDECVDEILNIFSKAQRTYYAFLRLAHIYRVKKYKTVVTDDLSMTPLDINHRNTFILIQNKSKYLFSLNDLIRIVETAITHAPNFFQEPKPPKNPYNNEMLDYSTLYNIYFKMKSSGRIMSTIFHLYFLSNLNLNIFTLNNEAFLRDSTIQNYINNTQTSILYNSILGMLKSNYYTKKLIIHDNFPKDLIVNIFRPFLYYYYVVNFDIRGTQRINVYKNILYKKLEGFYKYNKAFGRKIHHRKPKFSNKTTKWQKYSFVTHHIPFYKIKICSDTNRYYYENNYLNDDNDDNNDDDDNDDDNDDNDDNDDYNDNDNDNDDESNDSNTETTTQAAIIEYNQQSDEVEETDIIDDEIDDISLS